MLWTLEIRHYGPACDVSETGLYKGFPKIFETYAAITQYLKLDLTRFDQQWVSILCELWLGLWRHFYGFK